MCKSRSATDNVIVDVVFIFTYFFTVIPYPVTSNISDDRTLVVNIE